MCLAVVALRAHPRYPLVIAANRDEYHQRPTQPAHWWSEGWLAGRDLEAGGTWLGIDRAGRWALLTNVREGGRRDPNAPSRGGLVTGLLAAALPIAQALPATVASGARHNGFNLLAGERDHAYWGSNRTALTRALDSGIHGLSNDLLDTPWPKVKNTKRAIAAWCAGGDALLAPLLAILGVREVADDAELPSTGVTLAMERMLSAPFIVSDNYGTRSSTVIAIDCEDRARMIERSFDPQGHATGDVDVEFALSAASAPLPGGESRLPRTDRRTA